MRKEKSTRTRGRAISLMVRMNEWVTQQMNQYFKC